MLEYGKELIGEDRLRLIGSTIPLESASFDLIVAVSVFTHLSSTSDYWMTEIARLLSKDGVAFITFQDEQLFTEHKQAGLLSPDTLLNGCFITPNAGLEGGAAMGTYYETSRFKQLLERYFVVHSIAPRALFGHQSIAVVSARAPRRLLDDERLAYLIRLEQDLMQLKADVARDRRNNEKHIRELEAVVQQQALRASAAEAEVARVSEDYRRTREDLEAMFWMLKERDDLVTSLQSRSDRHRFALDPRSKRTASDSRRAIAPRDEPPARFDEQREYLYHFHDTPYRLHRLGQVEFSGWCLSVLGRRIKEVRLSIDGRVFIGKYGQIEKALLLPGGERLTQAPHGFRCPVILEIAGRSRLVFQAKGEDEPQWVTLLDIPIWIRPR